MSTTNSSDNQPTSDQKRTSVFAAFPQPSGWALGWDGAALKRLLPGRRAATSKSKQSATD